MKIFDLLKLLIMTVLVGTMHHAQARITSEQPIHIANTIQFDSKILNKEISMNLYLPQMYEHHSDDFRYPIIFFNGSHGHQFFHMTTGLVKHLSSVNRMPDSIVVSLNQGGDFPAFDTQAMWPVDVVRKGKGDPEQYLDFISQELIPYLQTHYRGAKHTSLVSVSANAVFGLYALTRRDDVFNDYIFHATADMIGMRLDLPNAKTLIDEVAEAVATRGKEKGIVVFGEADDDLISDKRYDDNLNKLKHTVVFKAQQNHALYIHAYKNERHYDALIKTLLSSFETLYPEALWAPKYRSLVAQPGNALENIEQYYQDLSKSYSFAVLPTPERWNSVNSLRSIGQYLLSEERADEAEQVISRLLKYMPQHMGAHLILSDIYLAQNKPTQRKKILEKGLQIATKRQHPSIAQFKEALKL